MGDTPGVDEPVFDSGFAKNVIMDALFTDLATSSSNGMSQYLTAGGATGSFIAGTGNTNALRVDSTPTNLSQSGSTVTAASAFFTSAMVGRLLVFGAAGAGNNPCYITAFSSSTSVTVSTSATVSSQVGSVYTVAGWALSGTTTLSSSIPTNSGLQGTSYSGGVYTYTVSRQWSPVSSSTTYLQLRLDDASSNILAGFQIPGAGDTINVGYFYVVTWQFNMTVTPSAPTAVSNIGTGINTAGNLMIESLRYFSTISSAGVAGGSSGIDGATNSFMVANTGQLVAGTYTQNSSILASGSEPQFTNVTGYATSTSTTTYTHPANTGTAVLTYTAAFNTTGNGASITALAFVLATRLVLLDVQLTTPYASPASGTFTFTFTFTVTIGRTVTN